MPTKQSLRPPSEADFTSRLRSAAVTARVGLWLGICFGICFATGLVSHYAQNPDHPVPFPVSPAWGYRVTQGLHVITGSAAVPLLLVKLWTVYPRLFRRPERGTRRLVLDALERVSIAVLVASAIFQLATGTLNSAQWYPWDFSFRATHYALAWVAIGSLAVHIAVKLPIIRRALTSDVESTVDDRPTATEPGVLTRRGLLRTTFLASGVAALAVAGGTVPWLRKVSVFAVRSGEGPQGVPINKSAAAAHITDELVGPTYRLEVVHGDRSVLLRREDLQAMTQRTAEPAHRLRRGLERRAGSGPVSACATCSTWSTRRRAATSTSTHCSRRGPTGTRCSRGTSPTTTAPSWRWPCTASRSTATTASRPG